MGRTIIRIRKENRRRFLLCDKGFLEDARLGLEAIGLLAWLLGRPDDWDPQRAHIARTTGTSQFKVRRAIETLDECGYVRRSPVRDRRTGKIMRWEIVVFETPQLAEQATTNEPTLFEKVELRRRKPRFSRTAPFAEKPWGGSPAAGGPPHGEPAAGGRSQQNTETEQRSDSEQQHCGVVVALEGLGIERGAAGALVAEHGLDAIDRALRCLRARRKPPGNAAGFVIQAVKRGWRPPAGGDCGPVPDLGQAEAIGRKALALAGGGAV